MEEERSRLDQAELVKMAREEFTSLAFRKFKRKEPSVKQALLSIVDDLTARLTAFDVFILEARKAFASISEVLERSVGVEDYEDLRLRDLLPGEVVDAMSRFNAFGWKLIEGMYATLINLRETLRELAKNVPDKAA